MPVSVPRTADPDDEDEDDSDEEEETETMSRSGSGMRRNGRPISSTSRMSNDGTSSTLNSRPNSGLRSRPQSNISNSNQRSRSLSRTGKGTPLQKSMVCLYYCLVSPSESLFSVMNFNLLSDTVLLLANSLS